MLISVLLLGFVIGMQHAFEADHLAAVSSLVSQGEERRLGSLARLGLVWGVGHTLALLIVCALVFFLPISLPSSFEPFAESLVGLLLLGLGGHLFYRLWRDRVHVHVHRHEDGDVHLHAHSHRGEQAPHDQSSHHHEHGLHLKTLGVGLVHGVAGSAALVVYVAATLESPLLGLVYVLVFGFGSMIGMAALSAAVAVPLRFTARSLGHRLTWAHGALHASIGVGTIGIGLWILAHAQGVLLG